MARKLSATAAFDGFLEQELAAGEDAQSDEAITAWIREAVATTWHYSGTCKMGSDPLAVVNDWRQVHGVNGLRVVDASIVQAGLWQYQSAREYDCGERSRYDFRHFSHFIV